MGLFAKSTRGFGTLNVSGRSRVPNPPTRMSAFMVIIKPFPVDCTGQNNEETYQRSPQNADVFIDKSTEKLI